MFFNNASSTVFRSKSSVENDTPLRKDSSKAAPITQRRRRALGDISNRKTVGVAGGGKGAVLKQKASNDATQEVLKSSNIFPPSSTKNLNAQVKFSKTPSAKSGVGGGGCKISVSKKCEQPISSTDYDGVFGETTRWSNHDTTQEDRPLSDLFPRDELNLVSDFRNEMMDRQKKEDYEKDRLDIKTCEEQLLEQINELHKVNEKDIEEMGTMTTSCGIYGEKHEELDLLNQKLPWEEEDDKFDSSEETCAAGLDPYSLWGDM